MFPFPICLLLIYPFPNFLFVIFPYPICLLLIYPFLNFLIFLFLIFPFPISLLLIYPFLNCLILDSFYLIFLNIGFLFLFYQRFYFTFVILFPHLVIITILPIIIVSFIRLLTTIIVIKVIDLF